jgi:hypothetical protein
MKMQEMGGHGQRSPRQDEILEACRVLQNATFTAWHDLKRVETQSCRAAARTVAMRKDTTPREKLLASMARTNIQLGSQLGQIAEEYSRRKTEYDLVLGGAAC